MTQENRQPERLCGEMCKGVLTIFDLLPLVSCDDAGRND